VSPSGAIHRRRRRRPATTALVATLLALLFHASVLGLLLLMNFVSVKWPGGDRIRPKPQAVTLRNLDPRAWAKNRGQAREQERPEPQRRAEAAKKPEPKDEKNPRVRWSTCARQRAGVARRQVPGREEQPGRQGVEGQGPDAVLPERDAEADRDRGAEHHRQGRRLADRRPGQQRTGQDQRPAQKGGGQRPVFDVPTLKQRDQIALKEQTSKGPGASVRNQGESAPLQGNSDRLRVDPGPSR
jgi:hypothetical protein